MKQISVSCAIVIKNDNILACQRSAQSDHPFMWEFPGGKIEPGETAEECIVREIKEELNITVSVLKQLDVIDHQYSTKQIRLFPFICQSNDEEPACLAHHELRWQPIGELDHLNWSEADQKSDRKEQAFIYETLLMMIYATTFFTSVIVALSGQ